VANRALTHLFSDQTEELYQVSLVFAGSVVFEKADVLKIET
jgi:hypothetical protein|tara:strand:- start:2512 stop:2634 length:123 start_codon:yes stop_codon:yes gene_type:complete